MCAKQGNELVVVLVVLIYHDNTFSCKAAESDTNSCGKSKGISH